jgi:CBS-domain-containing membrane protein
MGEIPRARWSTVKVSDTMQVLHPEDAVRPDTPAEDLLGRFQDGGKRVVVVEDGKLVGIVSAGDITRWLQRQSLS